MKESKHLNLVELEYFANWEYPVFGNVLYNDPKLQNRAGAILCDDCIGKKIEIKFAMEFVGDKIIYHPVEELEKVEG